VFAAEEKKPAAAWQVLAARLLSRALPTPDNTSAALGISNY